MGEIALVEGQIEYLNATSVLLTMAENPVYIKPNLTALAELDSIEDKTKDLRNFVLEKQKKSRSISEKKLLNDLLTHQERSKNHLLYDANTGLPNSLYYKEDLDSLGFDKICLIYIDNMLSLMSYLKPEGFYGSLRGEVNRLCSALLKIPSSDRFHLYSVSNDTMLLACGDNVEEEEFYYHANQLFKEFHLYYCKESSATLINRFVLSKGQGETLLESVLRGLHSPRFEQMPFLICREDEAEQEDSFVGEEFKVIELLNRAFMADGVVPYFQGIHDNIRGGVHKYEALMRIRDTDGTVYRPGEFLGIAKKYRLYTALSMSMIAKVMDLFENREETVSINISAYDVHSTKVCEMIYQKLEKIGQCNNLVFEFVEDEYFGNIEQLNQFISKVRSHGVRIAIDDFGSGYSNFREIIAIKPDYIKVYGEIIKTLGCNAVNDAVIDTLVFLARRMNAELVAEYVETPDIQQRVINHCFDYSQGFCLSLPRPFEEVFLPKQD